MHILSIIIPVYNRSSTIIRCLDSIDYKDAEIIVVDDGSTDSSAIIVTEYIKDHPNVRLIKKENGGVSSARNAGIESADGKYVMFIDADDYIVPGGISRVLELAEKSDSDVVTYRFIGVKDDAPQDFSSVQHFPMSYRTIEGAGEALRRFDVPDYFIWDALFKLSPILEHTILFSPLLSLREDDVFCGMLFCHVNKIIVTDLPLYRYVMASSSSSTHNQSIEKQRKLISSGNLAMKIRGEYVMRLCPEAMPIERLKYMRWVCHPKSAIAAGYSLSEYKNLLEESRKSGAYPLDYRWIHVAGLDYSPQAKIKFMFKTYLCNHPRIAYKLLRRFN